MPIDTSLAHEITHLLLASYFRGPNVDRTIEQVSMVRSRGKWDMQRFHDTAFISFRNVIEPALLLRDKGPPHFADEPISVAISALREFFRDHHYLIVDEVLRRRDGECYADVLSEEGKATLVANLLSSEVFNPEERLLLFPLTPVTVQSAFSGDNFSLVDPASVRDELPAKYRGSDFANDPRSAFSRFENGDSVASWLVTRGPSDNAAKKVKRVVLGALALGPIYRERYGFTLRPAARNFIRVADQIFTCTSNPHTPPLSDGLVIRDEDHPWVLTVDQLLRTPEKADRGKRNALDYFYRAWFLEPIERCSIMFMALDALYEHTAIHPATKRMKEGIEGSLRTAALKPQLKAMMRLRNSVIHGGSPDVFATSIYHQYWREFGLDLSTDLEVVTAKCLRREIFGDDFVPQTDPHAELLVKHQALGHIATSENPHVVAEWP